MSQARDIMRKLAERTAKLDPTDLSGLVSLQDDLVSLRDESAAAGAEDAVAKAEECVKRVEQIIFREVDDAAQTLLSIVEALGAQQGAAPAEPTNASTADASETPAGEVPEAVDESLLAEWLVDCREALNELESDLVAVDRTDDLLNLLAEIRRKIHTLKGECGILSLNTAQRLLHEAETAIDRSAEHSCGIPVDELLALLDWMRTYTEALASDSTARPAASDELLRRFELVGSDSAAPDAPAAADETDAADAADEAPKAEDDSGEAVIDGNARVEFGRIEADENLRDFITESREHIDHAEQSLLELERDATDREHINTVFRAFHTVKGVAGFLNLKPVVQLAHHAETLLDRARNGKHTLDSSSLDLILFSCDVLGQLIGALDGGDPPLQIVLNDLIDRLERVCRGEKVGGPARPQVSTPAAPAQEEETPREETKRAGTNAARMGDQAVKVNTTRLDTLVNMVGELVIAQQMIVQDDRVKAIDDQTTQRNLTQVGKIVRDLQEVSMSLRMVAVKGTFQKMARLVRDLSVKSSKKIAFEMEGEDTEIDRTVVEEIGDPLIHMIRNACDHGIEPAADRRAAGKPEVGRVTLRAYHQGGSIMIEIADDGRGLSREKILKKAVQQGILPPDRAPEEMSDSEVFSMIFAAGFSTAEKVTDISGRGVGMDVVRRNIEALRGKIEIESVLGKGTTFKMMLPLTMAIIDGMVVRVGAQRYVVPTLSIERTFRPTEGMVRTVVGRGEMVNVRDALLPVHRLNDVFSINDGVSEPTEGLLLVLETNDTRCCMLVDEIVGQQQVVIKSLGHGVGSIRGVSGGAILGDGRVALILDVAGLVHEAVAKASGN